MCFEKEYHNQEREAAYTELQEILNFSKNEIKSKIVGLWAQSSREVAKTNAWKLGQATSEKYKPTWVFFEKLQFLRPIMQAGKSKDNLTQKSDDSIKSQYNELIKNRHRPDIFRVQSEDCKKATQVNEQEK